MVILKFAAGKADVYICDNSKWWTTDFDFMEFILWTLKCLWHDKYWKKLAKLRHSQSFSELAELIWMAACFYWHWMCWILCSAVCLICIIIMLVACHVECCRAFWTGLMYPVMKHLKKFMFLRTGYISLLSLPIQKMQAVAWYGHLAL